MPNYEQQARELLLHAGLKQLNRGDVWWTSSEDLAELTALVARDAVSQQQITELTLELAKAREKIDSLEEALASHADKNLNER